jgi:uncharacterized protein (DUF1800 family)
MKKVALWRSSVTAALAVFCMQAAVPAVAADGQPNLVPNPLPASDNAAARFLQQASFGPTEESIKAVRKMGYPAWIDSQFQRPTTGYPGYRYVNNDSSLGCPSGSSANCYRDNYSPFLMEVQFFNNAVNAHDQLRQRVGFALSEIMVASGLAINQVYAQANYQNMLLNDSFGNFRQLMEDITLSPAMGAYLNMVRNQKENSSGVTPNENYARELLQLFTIGLNQLNPDGTTVFDANGVPVPTYDQDAIEDLARVFTGWAYPPMPSATSSSFNNPPYFTGVMPLFSSYHDTGSKTLLNGYVIPAGQDGATDLKDALDNIFNHPNVGPFICKKLIQHLVTSNPSPQYVARVVAAFNDNGDGVRGDMKAVIRAILLDKEARGPSKFGSPFGHMREPALLLPMIVRGIGGGTYSDGVYLRNQASAMSQPVFEEPTVFSFYQSDFPLPNSMLVGPEYQLYTQNNALTRANTILRLLQGAISADTSVSGSTGTYLDLTDWIAVAADSTTLINKIDTSYFDGMMSSQLRTIISNALVAIPTTDPTSRARAALYIALISADFQQER